MTTIRNTLARDPPKRGGPPVPTTPRVAEPVGSLRSSARWPALGGRCRTPAVLRRAVGLVVFLGAMSLHADAGTHPVPPSPFLFGPSDPLKIHPSDRPRLVLLTASWCQWCKVLEESSLPAPEVRAVLATRFHALLVDVDRSPLWMDVPGVTGLPALVVFDEGGDHVLTRGGYRSPDELASWLDAVADRLASGELRGDPLPRPVSRLPSRGLTPLEAAAELDRLEKKLFLLVNSNDGGFRSPSRHPFPALLIELERFVARGAPARVQSWVDLTVAGALRGSSPRLRGEPQPGLTFSGAELRALSQSAPPRPPRWIEGVEGLADQDPWLGLQDPVDGGVFRYAAGPGWYHPHFERSAADNLAWVELLTLRGQPQEADRILRFVEDQLVLENGAVAASQASNPFYFRLRSDERAGLPPPPVDPLVLMAVQARAARVRPARCAAFYDRVRPAWGWDPFKPQPGHQLPAPDEIGIVIDTLHRCGAPDLRVHALSLADAVLKRWDTDGLPRSPRLGPLATAVCRVRPARCPQVLAAVAGIDVNPAFPPPLEELARLAHP